jgi:hypothetical protein
MSKDIEQQEIESQKLFLKIKQNGLAVERAEMELAKLLEMLDTSLEDAHSSVNDPSLFSTEEWEALQQHKKEIDENLSAKMKNIRDPVKQQKKFSERGQIQPHWLFVR